MPSVTLIASAGNGGNNSSPTVTPNFLDLQIGDVLLFSVIHGAQGAVITANDLDVTKELQVAFTSHTGAVFTHIVDAADNSGTVFNFAAVLFAGWDVLADQYRNVDNAQIFDVAPIVANTTSIDLGLTLATTNITTVTTDSMPIAICHVDGPGAIVKDSPAYFTITSSSNVNRSIAHATYNQSVAGAVGVVTFSIGANDYILTIMCALKSDGSAVGAPLDAQNAGSPQSITQPSVALGQVQFGGVANIQSGPTVSRVGYATGGLNEFIDNGAGAFLRLRSSTVPNTWNVVTPPEELTCNLVSSITDDPIKGPEHCFVWVQSSFPLVLGPDALSGLARGAAGTSKWNIHDINTYNGQWAQLVFCPAIDPTASINGGSGLVLADVTAFGCYANTEAGSEQMFEGFGLEEIAFGREIVVDGGTLISGEEISFINIATADHSQTKPIAPPYIGQWFNHVQVVGGAIQLNGPIQIGNKDNITLTSMLELQSSILFATGPVHPKFFWIEITGSATTVIWGSPTTPLPVSIGSGNERWRLDTATQEPQEFSMYGGGLSNGISFTLGSTSKLSSVVLLDILDITLNVLTDIVGSTFIKAYLHTAFIPSAALFKDITIRDVPVTDYGLTITGAYAGATLTLDGIKFTNNAAGKDIDFAHTGDITIVLANGADNPSYTITNGGTVNAPVVGVTFVFDVVDDQTNAALIGYEWRLYIDDPTPGILGTVEFVPGQESAVNSMQTIGYTYASDTNAVLQIMKSGYSEKTISLVLGNSDNSVTIRLIPEENI